MIPLLLAWLAGAAKVMAGLVLGWGLWAADVVTRGLALAWAARGVWKWRGT